MRKRLSSVGRLAVVLLIGIAALSAAHAETRPDLIIAVNKLARGLEPGRSGGNVDVRVIHSIFDTLIRRDFVHQARTGELRLVPGLATSWKRISPTVMEFELRKGVKWHDGTDFTAEDVVFSFGPERVYSAKAPLRKIQPSLGRIASVEALGPYKVRFTMETPDPILEHRLSAKSSWIVQRANYLRHKKEGVPTFQWMATAVKDAAWKPVGTGPYKLAEYRASEHIVLAAHDNYWMGKPAAKSVTFKSVPEVSARIAGLVSGEFDMIVEIPPDQVPVVSRYDDLKVDSVILENTHIVVFNDKHPVLKNRELRQAMALAIDRKKLIDTLWNGKTMTPNGNQIEIFGDMYIKDFPPFAYDPEKARALVKASGYKGEEINYRVIPNYYTLGMEAAQILQEMWKDVGVTVKITPVENWKSIRADGAAIYPWSNTIRFPDPIGQIVQSHGPRSALQTRYKFWTAPAEFSEATEVLETSMDVSERRAAFRRIMEIYREDVPSTFLYNPLSTYGIRKGIEYTPIPQYFIDLRPDNLKIAPQYARDGHSSG